LLKNSINKELSCKLTHISSCQLSLKGFAKTLVTITTKKIDKGWALLYTT